MGDPSSRPRRADVLRTSEPNGTLPEGRIRSSRKRVAMRVPSESLSVLMEESDGALHSTSPDGSTPPRCRPGDVVLDIEGLDHIDGAGWLGVISCEQRVTNWGGRLRIDHGIRKILELAPSS